jgi:glycosyltransferase involved in cell wall biosynthesis
MAHGSSDRLRQQALPPFIRLSTRQQIMVEHLRRVLREFRDQEIPATVLKGPYLAKWAYRHQAHRTFSDIDVLVPRTHLDRTLQLLERDPAVTSIPAQGPKAEKRNIPMADARGVRFTVDLHWDLFSYTQLQGCADGATEWAWSVANDDVDSELGPIWHLPDETQICFLATHALLDHRFRLILFRDLTEVAERSPDWEAVGRFAHKWGLRSTTYVALLMASKVTDAAVPTEFLAALRPRSTAVYATEKLLPRTDLVRFDGHRPHPLNLSIVLLHDSLAVRARLVIRAPMAFPDWKGRVGLGAPRRRATPATLTPNRLALVVTTDRRRGAEVFGERLAGGLRQLGWQVNLLALSHEEEGPWVAAQLVSERSSKHRGRLDLRVVSDLRSTLRRLRPQVVLANGSATLQYAVAATRLLPNRPRLVYASIGEPLYWIRGAGHRLVQRALLSAVDLVLAVSESTKRQLIDGLGLKKKSVAVAPTGVPHSFFAVHPDPPADALRLLFLGNLSKEKNPVAAVEVTHLLSKEMPVHLRVVGEGPLQEDLASRVGLLGLTEVVTFAGSVEDVSAHLAWSDLLILTSETEGLPGVVLEAAAAGVPAVAFDVGGTAETIVPGETGELVTPGDVERLADAVATLAGDRGTITAMGERARAFAAERYSLDRAVEHYHRILSTQLAGSGSLKSASPS